MAVQKALCSDTHVKGVLPGVKKEPFSDCVRLGKKVADQTDFSLFLKGNTNENRASTGPRAKKESLSASAKYTENKAHRAFHALKSGDNSTNSKYGTINSQQPQHDREVPKDQESVRENAERAEFADTRMLQDEEESLFFLEALLQDPSGLKMPDDYNDEKRDVRPFHESVQLFNADKDAVHDVSGPSGEDKTMTSLSGVGLQGAQGHNGAQNGVLSFHDLRHDDQFENRRDQASLMPVVSQLEDSRSSSPEHIENIASSRLAQENTGLPDENRDIARPEANSQAGTRQRGAQNTGDLPLFKDEEALSEFKTTALASQSSDQEVGSESADVLNRVSLAHAGDADDQKSDDPDRFLNKNQHRDLVKTDGGLGQKGAENILAPSFSNAAAARDVTTTSSSVLSAAVAEEAASFARREKVGSADTTTLRLHLGDLGPVTLALYEPAAGEMDIAITGSPSAMARLAHTEAEIESVMRDSGYEARVHFETENGDQLSP